MFKRNVIKFVKVTLLLVLILILSECISRMFFAGDFKHLSIGDARMLYEPSRTRIWKFNPNAEVKWDTTEESHGYTTIKINSKGLRDYEYDYEHPENKYRIILFGNSMSVGFEVNLEDTFPKVMENISNGDLEVINMAVKAYDLEQEFVTLEEEGLLYNPDLVIIGFFIGSDFNRAESGNIFTIKDGELIRNYNVYNPKFMEIRNFLYKYSSVYNVIGGLIKFSFLEKKKEGFDINKQIESYKGELIKTHLLLKHFQEFLKERNIDLIIVIIPTKQQVYEEWFKEMVDTYGEGKTYDDFDIESPTKELRQFLKENDIPFIDLYPVLKDASKDEMLYLGFDVDSRHFNKNAHRIVGETIYSEWQEMYGNNIKN